MKAILHTLDKFKGEKPARLLLRFGLTTVFAYAAYSQLHVPADWTTYVPTFVGDHISPLTLVRLIGLTNLFFALWMLSGKYLRYAGLLAAMSLGGIVLFNLPQLVVTFRDIGLFFMALALAALAES